MIRTLFHQYIILHSYTDYPILYFQVGLKGESLSLHSLSGSSSVEWAEGAFVAQKQPLTWYKVNISIFKNQNAVYLGWKVFLHF